MRHSKLEGLVVVLLLLLSSCGGGSGSCASDEQGLICDIEGDYRVQLMQASSVNCVGGPLAGGGFGTETREVWVSIRRTGNGDAPVEVTIDDCRYLGRQIDATSFELAPVAAECGARIVITQLADGTFELFIEGEEPSGSTCTIDEVAALA